MIHGSAATAGALRGERGQSRAAVESWRGQELNVGNYYVLTLLAFIAATGCALVLTRRPGLGARSRPPSRCRVGGTPAGVAQ